MCKFISYNSRCFLLNSDIVSVSLFVPFFTLLLVIRYILIQIQETIQNFIKVSIPSLLSVHESLKKRSLSLFALNFRGYLCMAFKVLDYHKRKVHKIFYLVYL